jgi:hypothetical protein
MAKNGEKKENSLLLEQELNPLLDENPKPSRRGDANIISKKFFVYLDSFFKNGWKNGISQNDISLPQSKAESARLSKILEKYWNQEINKQNPSLFMVSIKAFGPEIIKKGTATYIAETARMIQPFLLYWMIGSFQNKDIMMTYIWAAAFVRLL